MTTHDLHARIGLNRERRELLDQLLGREARADVDRIPRRDEPDARLSFAQERLWFLDRLVPGNPFYNCDIVLPITHAVDVGALERALDRLVARHDQLRVSFVGAADQPRQVIAERCDLPFERVDLRHVAPHARRNELERQVRERSATPFDLGSGPLLRPTLFTLDDVDHVLLLLIHHVVCDGWSIAVLARELWECYGAELRGVEPDLAPLPIEYADFAAWQRSWMTGQKLDDELAHWERCLDGMRELALPTDLERPTVATYGGAFVPVRIPEPVVRRVRRLATDEEATPFMVLFAAFVALLGRLGETDDVAIGALLANRNRRELEDLVGFFVNTLVLRVSTAGDPSFRELVGRVRDVTLDASLHQDLPFEQLVHHLRPDRDLGRNPMVQVVAQHFQFAPTTGDPVAAVDDRPAIARGTSKFDLRLDTWDAPDGIRGQFEYSTDLYVEDTATRMVEQWLRLLTDALDDPDVALSTIALVAPSEIAGIVDASTGPAAPYDVAGGIHRHVERVATERPDSIAIVDGDHHITFAELVTRAASLHSHLIEAGVRRGDIVGVAIDRGIDVMVAELAVLRAGAAYLPIDPTYPDSRIELMIGDADPQVVVTTADHAARFAGAARTVLFADHLGDDARPAPDPVVVDPDDVAYVMYTSGSTGRPKGILVPHRGICRLVFDPGATAIGPDDRVGFGSNVSFDASTYETWGALANGACLVVIDHTTLLDPHRLAELVRERELSVLFLTTSLFDAVLAERPDAFARLRLLITGGSAFTTANCARLFRSGPPEVFVNAYGPTENTTYSTVQAMRRAPLDGRPIPIGIPIANSSAYVVDPQGRLCPPGVPGELWVGGDGVALGYLGRPELSAERFLPDPFVHGSTGLVYRTGDRVRRRSDGALDFLGRIDRQVKVRGFRIELAEVEAAIARHPRVGQVVVDARRYGSGDPRLVAYVCPAGVDDDADADGPTTSGRETPDRVVEHWHTYYDEVLYPEGDRAPDPTFDIAGWVSSFTAEPLGPETMAEQISGTVERILRGRPRDVLEIGCGLGLLAFRIAPQVGRYCGTDFSQSAIDHVNAHRHVLRDAAGRVEVAVAAADDVDALSAFGGRHDVVVINSVVQYFPSRDYLERVVRAALAVTAPGGRVFIGDVRALPLLQVQHRAIAVFQAADDVTIEALDRRTTTAIEHDHELAVAPEMFVRLIDEGLVSHVSVEQKRGRHDSELTRYRCDVTLHAPGPSSAESLGDVRRLGWEACPGLEPLERILAADRPASLWWSGVPNARLAHDRALADALAVTSPVETVADVCARIVVGNGIDPEDVWDLADRLGYEATVGWTPGDELSTFEVLLTVRTSVPTRCTFPPIPVTASTALSTDPQRATFLRRMVPELRAHAAGLLPEYMQPASYVLVDAMPINPNGKVEAGLLPDPDDSLRRITDGYQAPRSPAEHLLADIWRAVLGVDAIGLTDDFFADLGGNSLLATQVAARITSRSGVELPLRAVFERSTLGELAAELERAPGWGASDDTGHAGEVDVDAMSDGEVEAMLARLLAREQAETGTP